MTDTYKRSWNYIFQKKEDENIYAKQGRIPILSRKPFFEYKSMNDIPEEDIIYLKFDPIDTPLTNRKPFNILILGGSGDQKSLLGKSIWSVLHDAGFYIVYVDPKSFESGRAKKAWRNDRLPPHLNPKGIKLRHYVPSFILTKRFKHMEHNFKKYSLRLRDLTEKEMWMGLGIPRVGSYKVARLVQRMGDEATLEHLMNVLKEMKRIKEIQHQSYESAKSTLIDLQEFQFLEGKYNELDLYDDFSKGYSVCLSYNSAGILFMSFDVGEKIHRASQFYFTKNNRNPIMFFFDDAGYYAEENSKILKYGNFAVEEIKNIGNNYRSLGIYNCLIAQSLNIIDEKVAETYKYKIITPSFNNPESLRSINIPQEVIYMIQQAGKEGGLFKNTDFHLFEYVFIDEHNNWHRGFPFFPPCNHFAEVYNPK